MKREVSTYALVGALVALAVLVIFYSTFQFTGQVVLEDFTNETDCVNAGYNWEDITNETCTTETIYVNVTGDCEPCLEYEDINGTQGDCISWTSCVVNQTSTEEETCVEEVIGSQCVGDVCAVDFLELCLTLEDCETATGYWYNEICNAEEASCSNSAALCLDENNCTSVGDSYWYNNVCNELECTSDAQCGSAYECSEDGICVEWFADEEDDEESEETEEIEAPAPATLVTKLTVSEVPQPVVNPNQTKQVTLSFSNDGETTLTSCVFGVTGESASWVTYGDESKSLSPGAVGSFVFDVSVPENTEEGLQLLTAMVTCSQRSASTDFNVDVVIKKLSFELIEAQRTRDDRVRVIYSLEELAGNNQDVEFVFSLVDAGDVEVGKVEVNQSIKANSTKEFKTNININETLLPINETTNETLESELTLNINYNSEIYSSSVQEKVLIGMPVGFAIFGGIGTGTAVVLLVVVLALVVVLFVARRMRKSGKTLGHVLGKN